MRFPGFIGPSYTLRSVNIDCQRCINLYPEVNESGKGKEAEVVAYHGTPGLATLATLGTGPIRGIYEAANGNLYVVSGSKLYSVSSAWVGTELGTLNSSSGPVSMADNGIDLMVVDGGDGYFVLMSSGAFVEITDPDFTGADQVVCIDRYFIWNLPGTGQFGYAGPLSRTIDATDFAEAEGSPDELVAVANQQRDLWLFGSRSIEVFYNSGEADNTFQRIQGAYIEQGCAAPFSVAKLDGNMMWLGRDRDGACIIYRARGYQPERVSTHAVEFAIAGYGDVSSATAYTYQDGGHFFYVINFDEAETTWVYDQSTNMWHERSYLNDGVLERHRGACHAYAHSKHVVGDYETGKLYELSSTIYTDDGTQMVRRRRAPHLSSGGDRIFYHEFRLDMEFGTGLDGGVQGSDPQVMLRFSDDGGHTWSNEKWTGCGKIGQTKRRAIWRRLGASRDRVFEITISDPVKIAVIGADVLFEKGGS